METTKQFENLTWSDLTNSSKKIWRLILLFWLIEKINLLL